MRTRPSQTGKDASSKKPSLAPLLVLALILDIGQVIFGGLMLFPIFGPPIAFALPMTLSLLGFVLFGIFFDQNNIKISEGPKAKQKMWAVTSAILFEVLPLSNFGFSFSFGLRTLAKLLREEHTILASAPQQEPRRGQRGRSAVPERRQNDTASAPQPTGPSRKEQLARDERRSLEGDLDASSRSAVGKRRK